MRLMRLTVLLVAANAAAGQAHALPSPIKGAKALYERKVAAPRRARHEFNAFINARPKLKQFADRERRDESVGMSRFVERFYKLAGGINLLLIGGGIATNLANPHLFHEIVPGGSILPHLAIITALNVPFRGVRMAIKTKKATLDSNGEILAEAVRLSHEDPQYAISPEKIAEWYEAGQFRTKDYRKALKPEKEKKGATNVTLRPE